MKFQLLFLVLILQICRSFEEDVTVSYISSLNRTSFPEGFMFGTSTSSYQCEGGAKQGGRKPGIWDTFTHKYPGKIKDGSNGDVAVDSYNRYKEDIQIMRDMNSDAYRFSISWPRILPNGNLSGGINQEGISYYNSLIDELIKNGMQPFVTLFHWDVPQALEDEYGGFLNRQIVEDFKDFADVCFKNFGDRVKYWTTFNEPWGFAGSAYADGILAPGRCSEWLKRNCTGGDSAVEPYLVSHHQLLAHATAYDLYKNTYQKDQKGKIGMTLVASWMVPFSSKQPDIEAADRSLDFTLGMYMDPITHGQYPSSVVSLVKDRLPKFTEEESRMVKGSLDFVALNYYTASYAADDPNVPENASFSTDSRVKSSVEREGVQIGPKVGTEWIYMYPKGIQDLLLYMKSKYNNPIMYITENGVDEPNNATLPLEEALRDTKRVEYHHLHLLAVHNAIKLGANVKGYFAWSFLDSFEWMSGYTVRFGMVFVDYKDGLKRYPKLSAQWFKKFMQK